MRRFGLIFLALSLALLVPAKAAEAAAQVSIWPASFTYGTPPPPGGSFTWNATTYGLRFDEPLGPFIALRTSLTYGSIANLAFGGTGLSGYSGSTLMADSAIRVGLHPPGPLGLAAFAGYGGMFVSARGPTAPDAIALQTNGTQLGVEVSFSPSLLFELRGRYVLYPTLNAAASYSVSQIGLTGNSNGTGSGNEYEVDLLFSPLPLTTVYAGYRGGSSQISWSGGTTSNSFNGYLVGVELHF